MPEEKEKDEGGGEDEEVVVVVVVVIVVTNISKKQTASIFRTNGVEGRFLREITSYPTKRSHAR